MVRYAMILVVAVGCSGSVASEPGDAGSRACIETKAPPPGQAFCDELCCPCFPDGHLFVCDGVGTYRSCLDDVVQLQECDPRVPVCASSMCR